MSPHASPPEQTAPDAASRVQWVDVARGLGIILVVIGHAAGGLIDNPGAQSPPWLRYGFLALYTFHMPIFFFLAGLFVSKRLDLGARRFLGGILVTIAYPYFLWSVIQFTLIYSAGSLVNHPVESYWGTILALPWRAVSQFWFLHALFLIHLMALLVWSTGLGAPGVLGAALAFKLITMFVPTTPAISLAASNAPYYALGLVIGWQKASIWLGTVSNRLRVGLIGCAALVVILLCAEANHIQHFAIAETVSSATLARIAWKPFMLPGALLGGAALLMIATWISGTKVPVAGPLASIGKLSMPIFLMHILFIAGTRIAVGRLMGINGVALLPLLVIAGVAGPLLAKKASDRLGVSKMLGFG